MCGKFSECSELNVPFSFACFLLPPIISCGFDSRVILPKHKKALEGPGTNTAPHVDVFSRTISESSKSVRCTSTMRDPMKNFR